MNVRTYFKLSLLFPITIPALFFISYNLLKFFLPGNPFKFLENLSALFIISLGFGGLPYIAFAIACYRRIPKLEIGNLLRHVCASPFIFIPFVSSFFLIFSAINSCMAKKSFGECKISPNFVSDNLAMLSVPVVFSLLFGYFYVLITLSIYFSGKKLGWFFEETLQRKANQIES